MAGDVARRIVNTDVGKEGVVVIAPNGLKIVPTFASRQRIKPDISTPINAEGLSGVYDTRFNDTTYYTA